MIRPQLVQAQIPNEVPYSDPFPAFVPIVSDAFESLRNMPAIERRPKGHCLIAQDTEPQFVYLLRGGLVKLLHTSPDGHESIVGLRAPGWYAGAASSLAGKPCPYTVKCVTSVSISTIVAQDFSQWLSMNAKRAHHFTMTMCTELLSQAALCQIARQSADERLRHFLRESKQPNPSHNTLDVEPFLKRSELAQLLHMTPEHLSRMFPKLTLSSPSHHSG